MAKRILIADDSVTIQKAFAMTFAGAEDFTLASARSADEGLAIAQKTHPDLIIADGVMPGRSGYDLCASIRTDPALRAVPVLILASSQQPYDEGRGQKAGASGHLTKPWETNAILDKLRSTLRDGFEHAAEVVPAQAPGAPAQRLAASLPTSAIEDDEYGEISIDTSRDTDDHRARVATPPPVDPRARVATPPPPPPARISSPSMPAISSAPAAHGSSPGMRPSLIPGMRPGAMPPARPGTMPVRPTAGPGPGPAPAGAPARPSMPQMGRTMIGLPAANVPIPGMMRPGAPVPVAPAPPARSPTAPAAPLAPTRPPTGPMTPLASRGPAPAYAPAPPSYAPAPGAYAPIPPGHAPAPPGHAPAPPGHAPASVAPAHSATAAVSGGIEQKLAAFAAKGPEYEAIARLSREIIEQVVWEVVPELAEAIIREQVEKRGRL